MAAQRLVREYQDLHRNPCPVGRVVMTDDILKWTLFLNGPVGTPYEGGVFEVNLHFPDTYPTKCPHIEFKTEIFHANISKDGIVCTTLMSDWRPTDTVLTVILALSDMLATPNRDSAYHGGKLNDQQYNDKARNWTKDYAK